MSLNRKFKRSAARGQQAKTQKDLEHLVKVRNLITQLIEAKVLKVFPDESKALFSEKIWMNQTDDSKKNIIRNIGLFILSEKLTEEKESPVQVDLYSHELEFLATYNKKKVTILK